MLVRELGSVTTDCPVVWSSNKAVWIQRGRGNGWAEMDVTGTTLRETGRTSPDNPRGHCIAPNERWVDRYHFERNTHATLAVAPAWH